AARGTVKQHTVDARAFGTPDGLPLGRVEFGRVTWGRRRPRPEPLPMPEVGVVPPRVDIVMHHSDGDTVLFDASLAAGAQGVVLVGTGAGNANPQVAEAVRRAVAAGVQVTVSTRVAAGAVAPLYTGGGAVDLVAAGALLAGTLRPGQARIALLASLLATGATPAARAAVPAAAAGAALGTAEAAGAAPGATGAGDAASVVLRRVLEAAPQAIPASELYLVDGVGK
ncbi:MAG TPA: hypothetical protein VGL02_06755, partial [Streptomyces sp.]